MRAYRLFGWPCQGFPNIRSSVMLFGLIKDETMPSAAVGSSEDLLAELASWVRLETPTTDAAAVNGLMDVAERELAQAGAELTRVPVRRGSAIA